VFYETETSVIFQHKVGLLSIVTSSYHNNAL